MTSASFFLLQKDGVPRIVVGANEYNLSAADPLTSSTLTLACPLTGIRLARWHSRLIGIVGAKNKTEAQSLQVNSKGCKLPPRSADDDLIQAHESPPCRHKSRS
jgi:hypothetical protein